ncbi:hypothetical protein AVEN_228515-1 [Araneus ventricosus]|uniref:Uncharacterized protein n=1 Tax=Araneus ventricosus TaxID=182803 RepID=A0A4Y2D7G2_ARAVE|nr:hypothetical protein AVEN_228515-1 [Araneus ventricosus]
MRCKKEEKARCFAIPRQEPYKWSKKDTFRLAGGTLFSCGSKKLKVPRKGAARHRTKQLATPIIFSESLKTYSEILFHWRGPISPPPRYGPAHNHFTIPRHHFYDYSYRRFEVKRRDCSHIYGSYIVGNEAVSHWLSASRDLACY